MQPGLKATKEFGERNQVWQIKKMLRMGELFVCDSCELLIRNFMTWKFKRDQRGRPLATDAFEDKNNDALDALRYLITLGPTYTRQRATATYDDFI